MNDPNPYATPTSPNSAQQQKLYSLGAIVLATFLGSIPAGGWLVAMNYWRTKQSGHAWLTLLGAFVLTVVAFAIAFVLPENVPSFAILMPQLAIAYFASKILQGELLARHIAAGGRFCSKWAAAGWGLLCAILLVSILFVVLFFTLARTEAALT